MKQKFIPGGTLDLITPDEAEDILARLAGGMARAESHLRAEANGATGAGGALLLSAYTVPQGQAAYITRVWVGPDTATYATPFTNAASEVRILRNDSVLDGASTVAAPGLPRAFTYGHHDAFWLINGDSLVVQLIAGPAQGTNVVVRVDGWLLPLGIDHPHRLRAGREHRRRSDADGR